MRLAIAILSVLVYQWKLTLKIVIPESKSIPVSGRAVSFPGKRCFCRGSAPVPTLFVHDFVCVSEIGAGTGAPPLQENETALPPISHISV